MSPPSSPAHDAACFLHGADQLPEQLAAWRAALSHSPKAALLVAEPGAPLLSAWRRSAGALPAVTLTPRAAGLLERPFSIARVEARLIQQAAAESRAGEQRVVVVVDMDWLLQAPSAMANGAIWGTIIQRLLASGVLACLSLYHRRHLSERDLLAGLHAHAAVLAPEGCQVNPYQLPVDLAVNAGSAQTARQRLDHWLGHLSPALRAQAAARRPGPGDGQAGLPDPAPLSGGEPPPVVHDRSEQGLDEDALAPLSTERWKIRCLGSLRVYRRDGQPIAWHNEQRPGKAGATRKVRGLFAMLLMSGERGMATAELIDVLWPDAVAPEKALNRLHHTVNELRRLLLPPGDDGSAAKAARHPFVIRQNQRYQLRLPPNSWIDVEEFPQLCRQGGDLLRDGRPAEALLCFESALKLYTGELFADLPAALTDDGEAEWCAATRSWLAELCLKVHGDCARIQRELGNALQAAAHCRELLRHDPCSTLAHGELMRLHAAQGRREALDRQFQVYRQALGAAGHAEHASIPLMDLYVELMRGLPLSVKTPRKAAR